MYDVSVGIDLNERSASNKSIIAYGSDLNVLPSFSGCLPFVMSLFEFVTDV